ncbi:hypothetical protein Ddc_05982 [Ditylenchus destructor]|nr:hypothetical protein Ddc_05982 [Ditylenchus destructor]
MSIVIIFATFFSLASISVTEATPSVFSCPLTGPGVAGGILGGGLAGYPGAIGEVCGWGSFLHYWTCCEDYPFECCFQFETWAM